VGAGLPKADQPYPRYPEEAPCAFLNGDAVWVAELGTPLEPVATPEEIRPVWQWTFGADRRAVINVHVNETLHNSMTHFACQRMERKLGDGAGAALRLAAKLNSRCGRGKGWGLMVGCRGEKANVAAARSEVRRRLALLTS
jgi:hypothetical protein